MPGLHGPHRSLKSPSSSPAESHPRMIVCVADRLARRVGATYPSRPCDTDAGVPLVSRHHGRLANANFLSRNQVLGDKTIWPIHVPRARRAPGPGEKTPQEGSGNARRCRGAPRGCAARLARRQFPFHSVGGISPTRYRFVNATDLVFLARVPQLRVNWTRSFR